MNAHPNTGSDRLLAMRPFPVFAFAILALAATSCNKSETASGPPAVPPAAVSFVPATTETVNIVRELPGRIDAIRVAEVRARVPGILLEKSFEEGADVEAGQVLFQIDPAPLEAARDSAIAALARAEANAQQAESVTVRYRKLSGSNAVSQQDLDVAEATLKVQAAEVLAAQSALRTAELNLSYATVTAPIAGRIGRALVTEGALVGQGDATRLAVIQQLDPIYFDFTQSSADLIALRRAMAEGTLDQARPEQAQATLILDGGSVYEHPGRILFSEASVDKSTGMVTLRAEFPNPDRLLLPGMFARIKIIQAIRENAVTVPQRAVTRMPGGSGSVLVIDSDDHAQLRLIQTGETVGDKWLVSSGLAKGERVIVEGHLKVRPGSPVVPEPFVERNSATDTAPPN
jgi:membrane fusion protein (multidrug efflux system)